MTITFESVLNAFDTALELVEDPEQRDRLQRVIDASQASVERAAQDLVAGMIEEVNADLVGATIELRHTANGLEVSVSREAADPIDPDEPWRYADSELEKVTLRLPVELKDRATNAAKEAGVSVNAWFTRLLARELREPADDPPEEDGDRRAGRGHRAGHERRGRRKERRSRGGSSLKGWIGQ